MEPFVHLAEYPFVICTICKIGIVANEVVQHTKRHGHISRQKAKSINQTVQAIPDMIKDQAGLQQWTFPGPDMEPIPHIEAPMQDGLGCNSCPYIVRDKRQMQKHCRQEHGWVNDWKKGGDVVRRAQQERPPVPWRTGVSCQRWCTWGYGKRWFEVGRGRDEPLEPGPIEGDEWDRVAQVFSQMHEEDEKAFESEAKAPIKDDDDKNEAAEWLRRCGWAHHLRGVDKEQLQKTLEPIRDDESVLQRMWDVLDRVLENAYAAAGQYQPGSAELFEIERKEVTVTTTKPFQGLMEVDAWARYKEHWKRLLAIWQRMEEWFEEESGAA
jgi:hypothetical protein